MYKILYGIPAMSSEEIIDREVEDDDSIWCDFELDYYPDMNYYQFSFETMLGFEGDNGARNWILHCLNGLTNYMKNHNYDISKELNMWQVFTEGIDVTYKFKNIEDAYAWLKMMIYGFNGKGLFQS